MAAMVASLPIPLDALPAAAGGTLVVAFSGGLDSTVLLHRLAVDPVLRARGLRALHVHHGLQAAADAWAEHCARQAAALGVALEVLRVDVPRDGGHGIEAAAREARYAALAAALAPGETLATAHHLDDQAETFLLRALRASGPEGLGAMRPWRRFAGGWHWRPLLALPRATLRAWAQAHALEWIEDPSNALPDPDRNFLRLQVLPMLQRRWPHAAAALARSAELSAQADALLDADDAALLDVLGGETGRMPATTGADLGRGPQGDTGHSLDLAGLLAQPPARRARLLRRWVRELGLPRLPARGIERIEAELLGARADAEAAFAWSGARILRWRGWLHADRLRASLPSDWSVLWDGRTPLDLPDGGRLWLQAGDAGTHGNDAGDDGDPSGTGFDAPLRVRARRGGERIVLPGRTHSHALKHVLQERGVPPWRRAHLPLLVAVSGDDDGQVLAAGDIACAAPLDAWLRARGLRLVWRPPGVA